MCPAYLLPSQSIEQSVQSKQRIVQMEEVKEVLQRFDSITLAIVGSIGLHHYHRQHQLKTGQQRRTWPMAAGMIVVFPQPDGPSSV